MSGQTETTWTGDLMMAEETCQYLKVPRRLLSRYFRNHRLPAFTRGKERRFVRSDLEQWIRHRTPPVPG
jgi:excisionase family DNA binding protein